MLPKERKYDDFALDGNSITVGADVNLEGGVFPNCGLNLANARLGGDVNAKGAFFTSFFARAGKGQSAALSMVSAQVRRDIYLGEGLKTQGGIALNGLVSGGDIDFSGGAQLNSVPGEDDRDNDALDISDSRIDGNVFIDKGFRSHGGISISSAHIGGYFQAAGALFHCVRGQDQAIYGNDSIVTGDISIIDCKIDGSVEWQTGEASGDLIMSNTSIRYLRPGSEIPAGCSLNLDRTLVHGSILLDSLEAFGYVSLDSAHIGAELVLNSAKLHGRVGEDAAAPFSLLVQNATIGTNLQAKNVLAEGLFSILGSTLGGQFDATGGTFINGYKKGVEDSGVAIRGLPCFHKRPCIL